MAELQRPDASRIAEQVRIALDEDLGSGDLTAALIPQVARAKAQIICRESAILCGRDWFDQAFLQVAPEVELSWSASDGDQLSADQVVCEIEGAARALLTSERTALNFLQTLSGTASAAATYVTAVAGTGARILDTRKTVPGLRFAQKYAVLCGGASNHRIGLFDAVLIKENHIAAAGSVAGSMAAVAADAKINAGVEVEIEVESIAQLEQALQAGAKRILLDNFSLEQLREAVALNASRARLEASGGVNLKTIRAIAETGVDDISVGAITKDVKATDFSMLFVTA